jgi:hypothetical protein
MDVPVQYFQSVIAIELAVTGAVLWQIRYFDAEGNGRRDGDQRPDARIRLGLAVVLGATIFGSLWAIADEGPRGRRARSARFSRRVRRPHLRRCVAIAPRSPRLLD